MLISIHTQIEESAAIVLWRETLSNLPLSTSSHTQKNITKILGGGGREKGIIATIGKLRSASRYRNRPTKRSYERLQIFNSYICWNSVTVCFILTSIIYFKIRILSMCICKHTVSLFICCSVTDTLIVHFYRLQLLSFHLIRNKMVRLSF